LKAALALVLLLGACTPDFEDLTHVKDLRVLVVGADTPELVLESGPTAMQPRICPDGPTSMALIAEAMGHLPAQPPVVTLRPLVADPHGGGRPVHYSVVACLSATGTQDPEGGGGGGGMRPGGVRDTVGRGLCDGPALVEGDATPAPGQVTVPIEVKFQPTAELLEKAFVADFLSLVYGLPLTVQVTVSAGDEQVIARKRILFTLRLAPDQTPNQNPLVTQLSFRRGEDGAPTVFDLQNPATMPPEVHLGEELRIEPTVGIKEMYPTRIGDRTTGCTTIERETEALRYAFFATSGTFAPHTTNTEPSIILENVPPEHRLESTYHAPKVLAPDENPLVHVWVVTRDERAGASWVEVLLRLVP
jgi:hypothetical protein